MNGNELKGNWQMVKDKARTFLLLRLRQGD